jgi:metal-dependent amidase/aminoacylase/carboxypeptidase family protein
MRAINSTKDMRSFLIQQMQAVADGTQEAASAKAICNYAQQIYNTMNMEMRFAIARNRLGDQKVEPVKFN